MTSLFDRLRTWFGSWFDSDGSVGQAPGDRSADDDGGEDGDGASSQFDSAGRAPTVAHRDDRPLETPTGLDQSLPASAAAPSDGPDDDDTGSAPVEIPDAETVAAAATGSHAAPDDPDVGADGVVSEGGSPSSSSPGDGGDTTGSDEPRPDDRSAGDGEAIDSATPETTEGPFACSVCGTAVEEPTAPCPLCRSTDVVAVADVAGTEDGATRRGRTAVSTDDEAVDRLRDVRKRDR
jgi:hypothetical protein